MRLDGISVALKFPGIELSGDWKPDDSERKASWELYVELITRISVVKLEPEDGLLREVLSSLYSLFNSTREILKRYGPLIAQPKGSGDYSFGSIAVSVLNIGLRPLLAKWHPLLTAYESSRPPEVSIPDHERAWKHSQELRDELNVLRVSLIAYANILADAAQVPRLIS